MKSTITSKGQITLPIALRRRLGLKAGDVLVFDESAPYVKARTEFNRDRMMATLGRGRGRPGAKPSDEWIEETRGPVELP